MGIFLAGDQTHDTHRMGQDLAMVTSPSQPLNLHILIKVEPSKEHVASCYYWRTYMPPSEYKTKGINSPGPVTLNSVHLPKCVHPLHHNGIRLASVARIWQILPGLCNDRKKSIVFVAMFWGAWRERRMQSKDNSKMYVIKVTGYLRVVLAFNLTDYCWMKY